MRSAHTSGLGGCWQGLLQHSVHVQSAVLGIWCCVGRGEVATADADLYCPVRCRNDAHQLHMGLDRLPADLAVCPFCREGADKLQYELSLYLAIQQSVEHLRAAEAEVAEGAATAAGDVGKPRGRALRRAGAALAPKAAAGTGSGARPSAARQHGQAGPCQAQPKCSLNSDDKAARQGKRALVTAEAARCEKRAQPAAEDKGLVAGGGAAQGQAADAAAQAAGAATEPAEAAAQAPAQAAAQVLAAGSRKRGRPCKAPAEAAAQVSAAGSRRRGRPCKAPEEAAAHALAEAAAQVPAAGSRRRGRPCKEPATAIRSQPMALRQEHSAHSLLGKWAADGRDPDSSPRVKQTRRESPVFQPEDFGAPAGALGGAEGRTMFSAEAPAEGAGAAVLPVAEPAAGGQHTQGQEHRSPAAQPGDKGGAPAEPLVGAEDRPQPGAEDRPQPGAADAAEDAGAERTCQTGAAAAAANKAGIRAPLAADCAAAGGGGQETSAGGSVGPGGDLAAVDVRHGGRCPAAEAAADLAAAATLGVVQATAAGMPEAGLQGAVPAGLWAAGGSDPPFPTSEAVTASPAAAVKAEDVGTLAEDATATLRTAVSGGKGLGARSEGPCSGRSLLAAVSPGSDCPKPSPKSRLARTANWGSLFNWASC